VLGITLGCLGQHSDAICILLYAAVTWHQLTGHWDSRVLAWLHRESALTGPGELATLIKADIPPELAADLTAAIGQAPDLANETDEGDNPST
jgi:hypothetical protein